MQNSLLILIGFNPCRLKVPKGDELSLKGPKSMQNILLLLVLLRLLLLLSFNIVTISHCE